MWKDNDDKIMVILDSIETQNKGCFPVVCPICGEKDEMCIRDRQVKANILKSMHIRNIV